MRVLVIVAGAIVFVAGVFLWCGNVFGFFPTFPLVGYLTAALGVVIYKAGTKIISDLD